MSGVRLAWEISFPSLFLPLTGFIPCLKLLVWWVWMVSASSFHWELPPHVFHSMINPKEKVHSHLLLEQIAACLGILETFMTLVEWTCPISELQLLPSPVDFLSNLDDVFLSVFLFVFYPKRLLSSHMVYQNGNWTHDLGSILYQLSICLPFLAFFCLFSWIIFIAIYLLVCLLNKLLDLLGFKVEIIGHFSGWPDPGRMHFVFAIHIRCILVYKPLDAAWQNEKSHFGLFLTSNEMLMTQNIKINSTSHDAASKDAVWMRVAEAVML